MAIYRDEQGNIISRKSPVYGSGKRTEAQKRADRKYDALHYRTIGGKVKIQDIAIYEQYAIQHNMSMSKLITSCINYCINNNIDISGGVKLDSSDTNSPDETD
jgi:hypothetical protein